MWKNQGSAVILITADHANFWRDGIDGTSKMKAARFALLAILLIGSAHARTTITDEKIKQQIIQQSIVSYSGSCPCPYNTDRGGRRCRGRSAYSRAGGYETICYDKDVTPAMIKAWRGQNN